MNAHEDQAENEFILDLDIYNPDLASSIELDVNEKIALAKEQGLKIQARIEVHVLQLQKLIQQLSRSAHVGKDTIEKLAIGRLRKFHLHTKRKLSAWQQFQRNISRQEDAQYPSELLVEFRNAQPGTPERHAAFGQMSSWAKEQYKKLSPEEKRWLELQSVRETPYARLALRPPQDAPHKDIIAWGLKNAELKRNSRTKLISQATKMVRLFSILQFSKVPANIF